ncbi:Uma2 family endonuclease [candidate division KSB1 bacterium]|nr:Uma2 family endonuclease [candidate division KSB1 bacterium]
MHLKWLERWEYCDEKGFSSRNGAIPESAIRDWHEKFIEYEAAGVREYWIIDRENQRLAVYYLDEDRRYQPIAPRDGKLHSHVLPGFWVKIDWFWQGPLFDTYEMAKEMGIIS